LRIPYCFNEIIILKDGLDFTFISSGGINNFRDVAKSLTLGADMFTPKQIVFVFESIWSR